MEDSGPDSDNEVEPVDLTVGVTDKWLTMNEVKRRKKQKRKLQGESPKLADFKKQDRKTTPTGKKKQFSYISQFQFDDDRIILIQRKNW